MASNFACIGLALTGAAGLDRLVEQLMPLVSPLGELGGVALYRYDDPSGARLTLEMSRGSVIGLTPSFAGAPGASLREVSRLNATMIAADVVDAEGELLTKLAAEVGTNPSLAEGPAIVTAFGADVSVQDDEAAFAVSPASLLGSAGDTRMGPESFISYGLFGAPGAARPLARMHGVVLSAERRRLGLAGGGEFSVARVRTAGFEADLCLAGDFATPVPGNVAGGEVYLVAELPFRPETPGQPAERKSSWWRPKSWAGPRR